MEKKGEEERGILSVDNQSTWHDKKPALDDGLDGEQTSPTPLFVSAV